MIIEILLRWFVVANTIEAEEDKGNGNSNSNSYYQIGKIDSLKRINNQNTKAENIPQNPTTKSMLRYNTSSYLWVVYFVSLHPPYNCIVVTTPSYRMAKGATFQNQ